MHHPELGEDVVYEAGKVPLIESWIWPDDMTIREAGEFARKIEDEATLRLGLVPCYMSHGLWCGKVGRPCPKCGAAV